MGSVVHIARAAVTRASVGNARLRASGASETVQSSAWAPAGRLQTRGYNMCPMWTRPSAALPDVHSVFQFEQAARNVTMLFLPSAANARQLGSTSAHNGLGRLGQPKPV